jgi:hypothetical protein
MLLFKFFKMSFLKSYFGLFFILLCFVQFEINAQTTYYVDALSGLDNNNGTSTATAWKSLSKVNSISFSPGDQILFKSGQEFFGKLMPLSSGTNNSNIIFGKYGGEIRPIINGKNYKMCIDASGKQFLEFKDLILKNDANEDDGTLEVGADINRYGFYAHTLYFNSAKKNIVLKNLMIHKIYPKIATDTENTPSYKGYGIYFTSDGVGNNNYYDGLVVEDCEITDIAYVGISINKWIPSSNPPVNKYQKNIIIRNNNLHHIGGSGMVFFNVDGFTIENNTVTWTGNYDSNGDIRQHGRGSGFWSVRCKNGILQHNEFSHVRGAADSCGAHIDIENDNVIVQYNLSLDNAGGFVEFMGANTNCIYRYNVSINDGFRVKWTTGATIITNPEMYSPNGSKNTQTGKAIWFSDFTGFNGEPRVGAAYNLVYNNSIYVKSGMTSTIEFENNTNNNIVKNNIFYIDGTLKYTKAASSFNNTFDGNIFYGNYPVNIPFGSNDIRDQNPQFVNKEGTIADDYKILVSSPAIDSGVLIAANGGKDYWGSLLSESLPTDIGAHETNFPVLKIPDNTTKKILIYPNPSKDLLLIDGLEEMVRIKIINTQGKIISECLTKKYLDISTLPKGLFFICIQGHATLKFLKN